MTKIENSNVNHAFEEDGEDKRKQENEYEAVGMVGMTNHRGNDGTLSHDELVYKGLHTGMGKFAEQDGKDMRPAWDNQIQFLCACIAYAVGLGNIWRFPYLAQTYGGGAFLIPYTLMLIFEGIPLFLLELAVGQRLRQGAIGAWSKFHPYLAGIGVASMIVSFTVGLYYNTIVAWCFWYFFNSFYYPLPYSYCPLTEDKTAYTGECANSSFTEYFWYRETLNVSPSIEVTGGLQWWIVILTVLSWLTVWICMLKGIESSGKVMYVTATFPYLVLTIFLVRGLTLEGASEGVVYLFTPDLEVLKNPLVWLDAGTQIFFSLGLGFGGVIAFASYNPKKQDCQRDSLIIALINSFTSIFASVVIFAILGYKATVEYHDCLDHNIDAISDYFDVPQGEITYENYNEEVDHYNETETFNNSTLGLWTCDFEATLNDAAQGTGLVFIVVAEGIINMPGSPFWSALFFLMLLSLGLGSMFGTIEGVVTPLFDMGLRLPKPVLTGLFCLFCCGIAMLFAAGSGNYWLEIFNAYAGGIPLLIIALCELVVVHWCYGDEEFNEDIRWMIGRPQSWAGWCLFWYYRVCWVFISPVVLFVIFIAFCITTATGDFEYVAWPGDGYTATLQYPWYAILTIWTLIILPLIFIPGVWLVRLFYKHMYGEVYEGIFTHKDWSFRSWMDSLKFWNVNEDPDFSKFEEMDEDEDAVVKVILK